MRTPIHHTAKQYAHTHAHCLFITTVSAHHHTQPQDQPPPCTESPSERPCRQAQTHQQTRQRRAPQQRQQRETPSGWVLLGGNFGVWYPYRKPLLHVLLGLFVGMARFCGFWLCVLGVWVFLGLAVSFEGVYVLGACVKYVCLVVRCFLWVVV